MELSPDAPRSTLDRPLVITVLADTVALCRFPADARVPSWTDGARSFLTISRTPTELSIVADDAAVPGDVDARRGYRVLRVEGPLPLELIGIFAGMAAPLADAGVPIFPIATFDTDYLLVPDAMLERATAALGAAGIAIARESEG